MTRILAISLSKGGVGKTTTAVSLAAGLVQAGKRVLLIDTDTQGQVASTLGVTPNKGLLEFVSGEAKPGDVLLETRPNLYLLAGGQTLAKLKRTISQTEYGGEHTLNEAIKPLVSYFDYIIFDTAPSWDVLNVNVLFCAQELLCPVNLEILAIQGLYDFFKRVTAIGKKSGVKLKYILPTAFDRRISQTEEIHLQLQEQFGALLCDPIRYNVRLSEAPAHGQHIFEYAPSSNGAVDYLALTKRVLTDE